MSTVGYAIGTALGGQLQNPTDRFPSLRNVDFLARYPYSLPCFVAAMVPLSGSILGLFCLQEVISRLVMFLLG